MGVGWPTVELSIKALQFYCIKYKKTTRFLLVGMEAASKVDEHSTKAFTLSLKKKQSLVYFRAQRLKA